jgi:transcriptional regulator with XRE-family HTH domain
MKTIIERDIINRLKIVHSVDRDIDLARKMNISKNTLSSWLSRNSINWYIVLKYTPKNISCDWLVSGDGSMVIQSQKTKGQKTMEIREGKHLINLNGTITIARLTILATNEDSIKINEAIVQEIEKAKNPQTIAILGRINNSEL